MKLGKKKIKDNTNFGASSSGASARICRKVRP